MKHTVEVGGANEGDMHAQVTVIGRAVKAQVDTERHRRPCWVLGAAIEADLWRSKKARVRMAGRSNSNDNNNKSGGEGHCAPCLRA